MMRRREILPTSLFLPFSPVVEVRRTAHFAACTLAMLGMAAPGMADTETSFVEMLNTVQRTLAGETISLPDDGSAGGGTSDGGSGSAGPTAEQYWISDVDDIAQGQCKVCHQQGGTAANSGAELVFTGSATQNHAAMSSYVDSPRGNADLVLSKITGSSGHGGGAVISSGSTQYQAFEQYFFLLSGAAALSSNGGQDFWAGLQTESREVTLRRASILLSGSLAKPEAIQRAKTSEVALRGELTKLMRGEGFHQFLIVGADDRLLTDGLVNGSDFSINTEDRFPALTEFQQTLPKDYPDDSDRDGIDKPFFTRNEADWEFRWAIHREPLELIAHVIETNQSYKKILTADYTMVNPISSIAYRSGVNFDSEFIDDKGYFERHKLNTFKPGKNRGHIAWDDEFRFDYDRRAFDSFSGYQSWPHAGVLSTHAWLARYPSTDTNRNRARARWTYYHFLGFDIEKSAPRTTDPVALADTNNPTMNNTACTVCHARMDPLAGAYQLFGDKGHYRDQFGGKDSLARSYLYPEDFGGEAGSSLYQDGDTWYRDMRNPGFESEAAPVERDSLQWLAEQIANDPRFAVATVKFWWPAIFGSEPLELPEDPEGPYYEQRLRAFNAQEDLVADLGAKFVKSQYRVKELFAEMLLSPWYRASGISDAAIIETRAVELATVGRGRLLTPEELDRKNRAVFGRTWGQRDSAHQRTQETRLDDSHGSYKTFYGGTDSAIVVRRNRNMTALMSNVSENMAVDLACQAVGYDFNLPMNERVTFDLVGRNTLPGDIAATMVDLPGQVERDHDHWLDHDPILLSGELVGGRTRVFLSDATGGGYRSIDGEGTSADVILQSVSFLSGGEIVLKIEGVDLPDTSGFVAERWHNDEGASGWRGDVRDDAKGWWMHEQAWVAFEVDLPAGDYDIEVKLATSLYDNNVNESMRAELSLQAVDHQDQTVTARQVKKQMEALYLRATNHVLPTEVAEIMINELVEHAAAQNTGSWRDGAHCDVWNLWPDMEDLPPEIEGERFHDPRGVIRGWTMIVHSILSSAAYLHD